MEEECLWLCGGVDCSGKKDKKSIFDGQLLLTICERHFKIHANTMILCKTGYDVEKVLELSESDMQDKVDRLIADGADQDELMKNV